LTGYGFSKELLHKRRDTVLLIFSYSLILTGGLLSVEPQTRVGFLPWQKVFLPGQWKKRQKLAISLVH